MDKLEIICFTPEQMKEALEKELEKMKPIEYKLPEDDSKEYKEILSKLEEEIEILNEFLVKQDKK